MNMYTANQINEIAQKRKAGERLLQAVRNNEHPELQFWIKERIPNIMELIHKNAGYSQRISIVGKMPQAVIDAFVLLGYSAYSFEQGHNNPIWYSRISW